MKISIITSCYNRVSTIRGAIESVLAQDYPDIEYIIVDGASTDGSVEAIKDAIKAAMGDRECVQAGEYKITYKPVTTARIDTAALKKAMPDIAQAFTRESTVRRFCVA